MSTLWDIMSTLGGVQYIGENYDVPDVLMMY